MKRCMRWFVGLYPRAWRDRYAAEMEALIEQAEPRLSDVLDVLQGAIKMRIRGSLLKHSRWKVAAVSAVFGALVAAIVAVAIPARYISTTTVRIPSDRMPAAEMQSAIPKALSPNALAGIIKARQLRMSIDELKQAIRIRYVGRPIAFFVEFEHVDPRIAQQVTADVLAQLSAALPGLQVLDPPNAPDGPIFPNVRNIIFVGAVAGCAIGFLLHAIASRNGPQLPRPA
jgi:hypothetical protein